MANFENYKNKNGANDDNIDNNQQELKLEEKKIFGQILRKIKLLLF